MRRKNKKSKKQKKINCLVTDKSSLLFDNLDYFMSCKSKNSYESEWQAKFAADEQYEYNKIELKWYRCPYCNKWHLTSKI